MPASLTIRQSKTIAGVILARDWRFNSFLRADSLLETRRETRTVRFIGVCRCVGIRQIDGARSNFYLAVRVSGIPRQNRWIAKTDLTPVPLDKSAIQLVTPSQIYAWEGLAADVDLTRYSEARMP